MPYCGKHIAELKLKHPLIEQIISLISQRPFPYENKCIYFAMHFNYKGKVNPSVDRHIFKSDIHIPVITNTLHIKYKNFFLIGFIPMNQREKKKPLGSQMWYSRDDQKDQPNNWEGEGSLVAFSFLPVPSYILMRYDPNAIASFESKHVTILTPLERLEYRGERKKNGEYVRNQITPEPAVDELAE